MYSLHISPFPKILFQNESIETSADTTVPKKEIPVYVPVKIPPYDKTSDENNANAELDNSLAYTAPDFSTKSISENNSKNLYNIASYLAKIPDSPKKQAILQRLTDIQAAHESVKAGNTIGLTQAETAQIQALISDINKELVAEKQVIVRETGIELGNQTQKVQEAEGEFVAKNKEYQNIRTNLEKKLILWSKAEAGSDLQKLALTITPLLDENDYESIEKVLIQYKARQNQMNQMPESEKREKESKILVQMREFYKTKDNQNYYLTPQNSDTMNYEDFIKDEAFMIRFRKDSLGANFLAYEMGGKTTNAGGEVDELILAIKNAEFSAEDAKDSAQNLMTANSEKMSALAEYNTAIKEYETVIVQTQTFEKQFTQQNTAQTYPNYKTLTASDIPGTNDSIYAKAFEVNNNIKISNSSYAGEVSRFIPPNGSISIPSSTGTYYQITRGSDGSLRFFIPSSEVAYDVTHPEKDVVFYTTLGNTPIIQDILALGQQPFSQFIGLVRDKHGLNGSSGDIKNTDVLMNTMMQYMGKIVGEIADDMPTKFHDAKSASAGINQYFTPERQKSWRISMQNTGLMRDDRRINVLNLMDKIKKA